MSKQIWFSESIEELPPIPHTGTGGCKVIETIRKYHASGWWDADGGVGYVYLSCNGADILRDSRTKAFSNNVTRLCRISQELTGWEEHTYKLDVPAGCDSEECEVIVVCDASGAFHGGVDGSGASADGYATLFVGEAELPLEIKLRPEADPSEAEVKVHAHAGATGDQGSGEVDIDYSYKPTVGVSGGIPLPSQHLNLSYPCTPSKSLRASTTVILASYASSWSPWGKTADLDAHFENHLKILSADPKCKCQTSMAPRRVGAGQEFASTASTPEGKKLAQRMATIMSELTTAIAAATTDHSTEHLDADVASRALLGEQYETVAKSVLLPAQLREFKALTGELDLTPIERPDTRPVEQMKALLSTMAPLAAAIEAGSKLLPGRGFNELLDHAETLLSPPRSKHR